MKKLILRTIVLIFILSATPFCAFAAGDGIFDNIDPHTIGKIIGIIIGAYIADHFIKGKGLLAHLFKNKDEKEEDEDENQNDSQQDSVQQQSMKDYSEVMQKTSTSSVSNLSLWRYFINCLTKNYFNFESRARRKEFWGFWLFKVILFFVFIFLLFYFDYCSFFTNMTFCYIFMVISGLVYAAFIIPSLSVACRRLHDTNKSFWYFFFLIVPVIGWIVMLAFYCIDGTPGINNYGEDPKGRR